MIRLLPTRRLLAAAAALSGLLLSSCGPGTPSVPATTPAVPTPAVPTVAPSRTASEPGDDSGGGGGGGDDGGRNGVAAAAGSGEGGGRSGDG
jgi:hypothetical protein